MEIQDRKSKLAFWLIVGSVVMNLAFDVYQGNGPRVEWFAWTGHDFTPPTHDWDGLLFVKTILYDACGHISIFLMLLAAYVSPTRRIFKVMAWFEIFDLIDYAITRNTPYVTFDKIIPDIDIPVEFGLFKAVGIILFSISQFYGSRNRAF